MEPKRRACDSCHRRKIQCDASETGAKCNWCLHQNLPCTFDRVRGARKPKTRANPTAAAPRSFARRLQRIEEAIARSAPLEASSASSSASASHPAHPAQAPPAGSLGLRSRGCTLCRSRSRAQPPAKRTANTPLGKIYCSGQNFGDVCSRNGVPHLTAGCEQWIYSRTGEWPRFHHLYMAGSPADDDGLPASPSTLYSSDAPPAGLPSLGVLQAVQREFHASTFSLVFPLVDRVLFEDTVSIAYGPPPPTSPSMEYMSAKACVLAFMSVMHSQFPGVEGIMNVDRDACAKEAQMLATDFLEDSNITTLQTVFMLNMLETLCGRLQAASMYHAVACRIVFALGGHTAVVVPPRGRELTVEEREDRHLRSLFWLCYAFDKDIALRTGHPPIMCDDFCDLSLPDGYTESRYRRAGAGRRHDEAQTPWFPGDLRLVLIKSKVVNSMYSVGALRRSDAELIRTIREMDEELERWRSSVPAEYMPTLSVRKHVTFADDVDRATNMQHIELHLEYHSLLNIIHCASGRCMVDASGPGQEKTPGVESSLDLSVEASRSTLIYLGAAAPRLAAEAFWVFLFYPISALMTVFFNLLRDPLNGLAAHDLALLSGASDVMRRMPRHRATAYAAVYLDQMDSLVVELSRLSRCAIDKARAEREGYA